MERIFYFLTDLSSGGAYFIIFGILIACGLGFPLPEDIPLVATGYLIWDETLGFPVALAVTLAGVLGGDSILFYVGKHLGMRFLDQGRLSSLLSPEKIRRVRAYFRKYGDKIVFFARFVAGFRAAAFFMAGVMRMPYRKFIWLDGLAALISVPVWIGIGYGLGYYFGEEIARILVQIKHLKDIFALLIGVIIAAAVIRSYTQYRKAKEKRRTVSGEANKG